jgi:hypothetical protein
MHHGVRKLLLAGLLLACTAAESWSPPAPRGPMQAADGKMVPWYSPKDFAFYAMVREPIIEQGRVGLKLEVIDSWTPLTKKGEILTVEVFDFDSSSNFDGSPRQVVPAQERFDPRAFLPGTRVRVISSKLRIYAGEVGWGLAAVNYVAP